MDELNMEELEQVNTVGSLQLNDFMTAYEQGNYDEVVKLGGVLLSSPMFEQKQKEEIQRIISEANQVLANNNEEKRMGL